MLKIEALHIEQKKLINENQQDSLFEIIEFLKLSEYTNYENFCKLFAQKYEQFIEKFDQPEFFTLDDPEITKTTDERKNYYE